MYRVCGSVGCVFIECQSCHLPIAPVLVACRSEDQAKREMLEQRHRLVDAIIDENKKSIHRAIASTYYTV